MVTPLLRPPMSSFLVFFLLHVSFGCQPPLGAQGPAMPFYGNYLGQGPQLQQSHQGRSLQHQAPLASYQTPLFNGVPSANSLDSEFDSLGEWSTEAPTSSFQDVDCSSGIRTAFEFLSCTEVSEFGHAGDAGDAGSVFCNFKKGERCRFHNAASENLFFRRAKFRSSGEQFQRTFQQMTRRADGSLPSGAFLFVGEPLGKPKDYQAALEAQIPCQKGDGKLKFRHWKTSDNVTLRVCTRDSEMRSCTEAINYDYEEVLVNVVNPGKAPFFVEILVSGFSSPSLFALDDLEYEAQFCEGEPKGVSVAARGEPTFQSSFPIEKDPKALVAVKIQPKPANPGSLQIAFEESKDSLAVHKLSPADLIGCDFQRDLCKYRNGKSDLFGNKYGEWKVTKGRVGNLLTGIRANDTGSEGYAYVGTDSALDSLKGRRVYVLESSPFSLDSEATLLFDVYRRARAISLQVCLDSLTNCPYEVPQIDKRVFWRREERVAVPQRTRKIFFVATQWQKFKWLAISNVRLASGPF